MMRIILAAGVAFYLLSTVAMAGGVVMVTLWAYGVSMKPLADTVSAAILNGSAATLLWLAFFGGFDMFFTVWQMMQNRQQAEQHRKEKEGWEEERKAQAQALDEQRRFQQMVLDHLAAEQAESRRERAQFLAMMARFMELTEGMMNGNGNRNGSSDSDGGNGDVSGSGGNGGGDNGGDGSTGGGDGDNDGDGSAHTAPGDAG